ncbi:chemotaxis-specific protein-glutamate methyltransferase CheB [Clostridium scatologenes]|uniref:Protein-glutamate methylesterase/protein-glutamine glutaminase n=1 Tax=Clostridium scatologenes TaxID=1548 RepID=A0A0E3JZJ5_CLOSL|nr:chemotaxis-specific protein-glutamate methyltransferase CheB [Clostridium scatologenes]AKA68364.1 response regulator receiver modulated CheB methylesterase [Clostridium scatologenes]
MIKVLVVDDSLIVQQMIVDILNSDKDIKVIGVANSGESAIKFMHKNKPDIVTMDIIMPGIGGFEAIKMIMETNPVPIIVISGLSDNENMNKTFEAMESGAVSVIEKPLEIKSNDFEKISENIIKTVKLMSEIKVVKRKANYNKMKPNISSKFNNSFTNIKLVVIGVSTGGPPVLQTIFSKLPENIKVPILVVQHIVPGFINGLIDWLSKSTKYPIHIAKQEEKVLPGHIYFAPDGFHMEIRPNNKVFLSNEEKENGLKPSVSHLFRSAADYYGKEVMGILLTGMGRDGAKELKLLKDKGALTVVQDKESSVVYGMPGEAVKLGAETYILSPEKIVELFKRY